jgi:hypothetical protein
MLLLIFILCSQMVFNGIFAQVIKKSMVLQADEESSRNKGFQSYLMLLLQVKNISDAHSSQISTNKFIFLCLYDNQIHLARLLQVNDTIFLYRPYSAEHFNDQMFEEPNINTGFVVSGGMQFTVKSSTLSPFVEECYEEFCSADMTARDLFLPFHLEYGSASVVFKIVNALTALSTNLVSDRKPLLINMSQ